MSYTTEKQPQGKALDIKGFFKGSFNLRNSRYKRL